MQTQQTKQRRPYAWVLSVAAVGAATAIAAAIGAAQAERSTRVLGFLDPAAAWLRRNGQQLIDFFLDNAVSAGQLVTAIVFVLAVAATVKSGRKGAPLFLMAAAFSLITWGEVSLLADALTRGMGLYAAGFTAAVVWGFLRPLPQSTAPSAGWSRFEPLLVVALLIFTLLTRTYALTELAHDYEAEMIVSMFSSRTLAGLHQYIPWGLTDNTNGIVHLLPQWVSFSLLGVSVFSLRFVSVACALVATALFYSLMRRIGGLSVAVIGTLLFIAAPDQLFWSRQENTPFQFVTLSAVIAASLAIRMVERPSFRTLLAACAWMPMSRLFYGPAMVTMLIPPLLYAHSLLFVRGTWRTLWYAIPILAAGVTLWVYSLTAACSAVAGHACPFINPVKSAGAPVWQGEGTFRNATFPELVRLQAGNLAKNGIEVAQSMTYRGGFTNWYRRSDMSSHPTTVNVAVTALLAIGVGYLLGQLYEPRAFALLLWVGLGMLPALLSVDPAPRRMVTAFPGFYAVIAVTLGAVVWQLRAHAHRAVTALAHSALAAGVVLIAAAAMASYFLLLIRPTYIDQLLRGSRPIFEQSDAIYHNVGAEWEMVLAWGHSDVLFGNRPTPCFEGIKPRQCLQRVLDPNCSFESPALAFTLTQAELDVLRDKYDPQVITFLMRDDLTTTHDVELLHQLLPESPVTKLRLDNVIAPRVVTLQTDRARLEDLRTPRLRLGAAQAGDAERASNLLSGVTLRRGEPLAEDGVLVEASLIIERSGWYKFQLVPACAHAQLAIDGRTITSAEEWIPLSSYAHAFTLKLPAAAACPSPLQLTTLRNENGATVALAAPTLAAPGVAALSAARANPVIPIQGYREGRMPFTVTGTPIDFVVETTGSFTILVEDGATFRIVRLTATGTQEASWELPQAPLGLSLAPDGTLFIPYQGGTVVLYARDGTVLDTWVETWVRTDALGHLADGSLLNPIADRNAIVVLDRHGRELRSWRAFAGGPKTFFEPWSVGVNAQGDILIIQTDGVALQFRTPTDRFAPQFVRSFRIDFHEPSAQSRGWAFDEVRGRILVPDPTSRNTLVFSLDGVRLMAADPSLDLSQQRLELVRRIVATADAVYTIDNTHRLRKFLPLDPG